MQLSRQSVRLREQAQKLREQDTVIAEMKRHMQEWDLTLSDLKAGRLVSNESNEIATSESSSGGASTSDSSSNLSNISNVASTSAEANEEVEDEVVPDSNTNEDSSSNSSQKLKRTHSELPPGPVPDEMALRAKRFCRILKFCENKSMKHNET